MKKVLPLASLVLAVAILGCDKSQEKPVSKENAKSVASTTPAIEKPAAAKEDEHGHEADDKSAAPGGTSGHGGEVIELGTIEFGGHSVRASRDNGDIKAGGDAPIDVWLAGGTEKVVAVRFWIGSKDAKGSVKAKADIEDPKEPNHWHTHTEVPNPLALGSKLWVEIETEGGVKTTGSFDLKA